MAAAVSKRDSPARADRDPLGLTDRAAWLIITGLVVFLFRDILLQNTFFWEDFLYQYYAFRTFAAASLSSGELPLWNPYTFSGMPFQADIQSAIFYIPNLLLTPFVSGGSLHYVWVEISIIAHYVLAGIGMYLLAGSYGLGRVASLLSAISYMFSGFLLGHLIHQGFIYQAAWFPLIVFVFRRSIGTRRIGWTIIAGLLIGHALLAGAPQVTLYILLYLFLLTLFEGLAPARGPQAPVEAPAGTARSRLLVFVHAGIAVAIAVGITAVQILPTLELAPLSQRADFTYERAAQGSLEWEQLVTFLVPKFFGWSWAGGADYAGPGTYWMFWETAGYFGATAFVLAVIAVIVLRRDRRVIFLAGSIVFGVLYALGDNFFLHRLFHDFVPGFESFRVPGRMVLYVCFSGPLLAGIGLQHVWTGLRPGSAGAGGAGGSGGPAVAGGAIRIARRAGWAALAGAAAVWIAAGAYGPPASVYAPVSSLFLGATGVAFLLAASRKISPALFLAAMLGLQTLDGIVTGNGQNDGGTNPREYYSRTSRLVEFLRVQGEKEYFRINSREGPAMLLDRNQGMVDRIFMMEGYTPLGLARFIPPMATWNGIADLMNAKYRVAVTEQDRSMSVAESQTYVPRAFFVPRAIIAQSADEAKRILGDTAFNPRSTVLLEREFLPAGFEREWGSLVAATSSFADTTSIPPSPSSARIVSYRLNSISLEVTAPADGFLLMSEVYYPGWKAFVDGAEVPCLRADWCLRAVPLRSGSFNVELRFEPQSFATGSWISILSLGLAGVGLAWVALSARRKRP